MGYPFRMYASKSEDDYDTLKNAIAALGMQVTNPPTGQTVQDILHHMQTIYEIEKNRHIEVQDVVKRLDKIEKVLKNKGLWNDDDSEWEDDEDLT